MQRYRPTGRLSSEFSHSHQQRTSIAPVNRSRNALWQRLKSVTHVLDAQRSCPAANQRISSRARRMYLARGNRRARSPESAGVDTRHASCRAVPARRDRRHRQTLGRTPRCDRARPCVRSAICSSSPPTLSKNTFTPPGASCVSAADNIIGFVVDRSRPRRTHSVSHAHFSRPPAMPMTRQPLSLAICTAIEPTAPAAAEITTVSPGSRPADSQQAEVRSQAVQAIHAQRIGRA